MASPSDPSSPSGLDRSDAEPARENDLAASFADLVRRHLPNWSGVGDPRFVEEEIEYKRNAAARIQELLAEETLRDLAARERFAQVIDRVKKAAQATNLLFRGVPSTGDLAVLNADGLDPASFSAALLDLLHGGGASPERLERFSSYLDEHSLPNKWALPTYLLFFLFPRTEMFVKPRATQWVLRQAGVDASYTSRPSGEVYAQILALVNELLAGLEPLGARDMIDVQSVVWVAHWVSSEVEELAPSDAKRREMELLFEECAREYLPTPEGREHLAAYEKGRERARASWAEIVAARDAGEDVTDRVLRELLPYTDSAANRKAGAWAHVAPAITGDLKKWFEAKGWQKPEDWQRVAAAIVELVARVVDDPSMLEAACRDFDALPWSKGFQTGMLTPVLNALAPDDFLLVNNKSRRLINYLAGRKLSQKLTDYPEINRTGKILIEHLVDLLESAPSAGAVEARTEDVFDAFAHWLVSIRNFPFGGTQYWKLAPDESAKLWEDWLVGGFASIGWNDLGDLSRVSYDEFCRRRDRMVSETEGMKADRLNQVWKVAHEVREGDKIVANDGTRRVVGFGTVTGPYEYVPDAPDHGHRLPVDWDDVRPRRIEEGGWRRSLVALDREKFEKLLDAPVDDDGEPPTRLTRKAFDLLEGLFQNPTRSHYAGRQDDFKQWVETPFRDLMTRVIALLPEPIIDRMETEKNLFGRIPKNDYGRGGAWPFYWGALYPEGGRRLEDAQLILAIKHDRLEAGFYIGEYGSESRQRFLSHVARHQDQLARILGPTLSRPELLHGDRHEDEEGHI